MTMTTLLVNALVLVLTTITAIIAVCTSTKHDDHNGCPQVESQEEQQCNSYQTRLRAELIQISTIITTMVLWTMTVEKDGTCHGSVIEVLLTLARIMMAENNSIDSRRRQDRQ